MYMQYILSIICQVYWSELFTNVFNVNIWKKNEIYFQVYSECEYVFLREVIYVKKDDDFDKQENEKWYDR